MSRRIFYSATVCVKFASLDGSVTKPIRKLYDIKEESLADAKILFGKWVETVRGSPYEVDVGTAIYEIHDFWYDTPDE